MGCQVLLGEGITEPLANFKETVELDGIDVLAASDIPEQFASSALKSRSATAMADSSSSQSPAVSHKSCLSEPARSWSMYDPKLRLCRTDLPHFSSGSFVVRRAGGSQLRFKSF